MKRKLLALTIFLLFIITQFSSTVYLPVIPKIASLFANKSLITSAISLFFLGYAVGQLFWGVLSDYIGRYVTLFVALLGYIIFQCFIAVAGSAIWFVTFLSLTGFCSAANTAVGNALVKDIYNRSRARKMIGYIGVVMASGPVFAPLISAWLYSLGSWRINTLFLIFLGVLTLLSFIGVFSSQHSLRVGASGNAPLWVMVRETLSDKTFVTYISTLSLTFGIYFALLLVIPFSLIEAGGFSVDFVGYSMFGITLSGVLGTVFNVYFSNRKAQYTIVNSGLLLMVVGLSAIFINTLVFKLISVSNFLFMTLVMFGIGIVLPATKAGAMITREKYVGTAASFMKLFQSIGAALMTQVASYFINHGQVSLLIPLLWIVALFTAILMFFQSKKI